MLLVQEQGDTADAEDGRTSFHDSGSSLTHHPSPNPPISDDPAAANCWDIEESDIVICKRPDGSDWLLNTSESGGGMYAASTTHTTWLSADLQQSF